MEKSDKFFGERLRRLIAIKGETQGEFAQRYGIAQSQLYNWLKREAPPLPKHWEKLAAYFAVDRDYIAFGSPEKEESVSSAVHEAQASYGAPTPPRATTAPPHVPPRRQVEIAPKYRLSAEPPTEKQCLEYLAAYLAAGRDVPGAAAHTWLELQERFPLARWEKLQAAKH